ncbi:hypothetical protein AVEN_77614-1 [Araneus ventricosus]|uniref:Uncharacterized protein n=1 Tax=Araneus ventricosus TaxID=182803 RepID=A0A4Y2SZG8_ARAVE|nr:hypothetical protein AVEN_77614-1 [Araneus ventricosus]
MASGVWDAAAALDCHESAGTNPRCGRTALKISAQSPKSAQGSICNQRRNALKAVTDLQNQGAGTVSIDALSSADAINQRRNVL